MITLIDGNSLLFRAFYGLHTSLSRSDGTPVNAVYGLCNMILPILNKANSEDSFICIFDASKYTFRTEIYKEYKANRQETPKELLLQKELSRNLFKSFGIPVLEIKEVEADDVIATLVKKYSKDFEIRIITSDKDLMQLVSYNVFLYDTLKEKEIREKEVIEKFGVSPNKVVEVQSLIGDSCDNVPGVLGIGPKKATELINKFETLENIYFNLDKIENKRTKELLISNKENAFLSKNLVKLKEDVELNGFEIKPFVFDYKGALYFVKNELESESLKTKIEKLFNKKNTTKIEIQKINSLDEFLKITEKEVIINIKKQNNIDLYLELLSDSKFYYSTFIYKNDINNIKEKLKNIVKNKSVLKVAFDFKNILHFLNLTNFEIQEIENFDDILLISYLINGISIQTLNSLFEKYLGESIDNNIFSEKTFDLDLINSVYKILKEEIKKDAKLLNIYEKCDLPLLKILFKMENIGVLLDKEKLFQLSNNFHSYLNKIEEEIFKISGVNFNISSPKQLGSVLFDKMGMPSNKNKSTDADTLSELIELNPIIEKILEYRSFSKLISTYTDSLPKDIKEDGRIHTTYLQTSTNTARLSSRDPNLQNIPIKTEDGRKIRNCFISDKSKDLLSLDYSQFQLRLLADIADVKVFKDTFNNDLDIHIQTAKKIFNLKKDSDISSEQRRIAKTVNFSIIYGVSAFGLARQLQTTQTEAKNIIDSYMQELKEVRDYIEETKDFAKRNGYVITPWGRKIFLDLNNRFINQQYLMRAAINAPVQGFEADIMRFIMVQIDKEIFYDERIKMILQIHDEIVFEVDSIYSEELAQKIKNIMENSVKLSIPLKVDYKIDKTW